MAQRIMAALGLWPGAAGRPAAVIQVELQLFRVGQLVQPGL